MERWSFCSFGGSYGGEKADTPHPLSLRARAVPFYYNDFSQGLYIAMVRQHFAEWFKKHGHKKPVPPISAEPTHWLRAWDHAISLKMAKLRRKRYMGYLYSGREVKLYSGWQRNFSADDWMLVPEFLLTAKEGRRISCAARRNASQKSGEEDDDDEEAETSAAGSRSGSKKGSSSSGSGKKGRGRASSLDGFVVDDDHVEYEEDASDEGVRGG